MKEIVRTDPAKNVQKTIFSVKKLLKKSMEIMIKNMIEF